MKQKLLISIILSLLILVSCGEDNPSSPTDNTTETQELKELCQNVDTALKASDVESLESLISEETLIYYKTYIESNTEKLQGFAEVFSTRKLIKLDNVHAVYEINYQGKYFQITITKDDDGKWKLTDI